jgi:hypothetical protein
MITTIFIILLGLVVMNFLLLFFSVNKTTKRSVSPKEELQIAKTTNLTTNRSIPDRLAPTGS